MREIILSLLAVCATAHFNLMAQVVLDAKASDPAIIGWMQGFPPPEDKIVSAIEK